jgi:hypothetical protein
MNEEKAREILNGLISSDDGLYNISTYILWHVDSNLVCLDGDFTADELEAIAFWMRAKKRKR